MDDQTLEIATINLDVRGEVPGIGDEELEDATSEADQIRPVTSALRGNVEIQLDARLEDG